MYTLNTTLLQEAAIIRMIAKTAGSGKSDVLSPAERGWGSWPEESGAPHGSGSRRPAAALGPQCAPESSPETRTASGSPERGSAYRQIAGSGEPEPHWSWGSDGHEAVIDKNGHPVKDKITEKLRRTSKPSIPLHKKIIVLLKISHPLMADTLHISLITSIFTN